ncbi:MAG: hypothetical protein QXD57_01820 [Ignisphaera sp.]
MPRRRMVPISEEIIDEAIKIGERIGIPYLVLVEKILSSVLRIMHHKGNILDVLSMVDALDDIKRLGGILFPASMVNRSLIDFKNESFQLLCNEYIKMCTWFGELSRIKRSATVNEFKSVLALWLPIASIDVSHNNNDYKFVIGFLGYSPEVVSLARCIIEGLIRGYNLNMTEIIVKDFFIVIKVRGFVEE